MTHSALPAKKTKVVCTIGPASQSRGVLEQLITSGMNVARINFAHGDFDSHTQVIQNIRHAAAAVGQRVAIFGDLPGPKMRIGKLVQEPVTLERDQPFILKTDEEIEGTNDCVSMNFENLPEVVNPGDKIFINDGFISVEVEQILSREVHCKVLVGGELRSHKGINFPGIDLGISAFTEQDRLFLQFAAECQLDGVSQSFVQNADDIKAVRAAALEFNYEPFIIAKIERSRAVDNLDEILDNVDGIMVARGDLGVEIPIENVASVQKHIIARCNLAGKPVITATHMLESMISRSRPTRAEATDVANAILDGTDCVMLSGETAMGNYPIEAVATMTRIARATERDAKYSAIPRLLEMEKRTGTIDLANLVSFSTYLSAETLEPDIVFTPTDSGLTASRLTRFRLPIWIVAFSRNEATCQKLQFSYGVHAVYEPVHVTRWTAYVTNWFQQNNLNGRLAILTEGAGTLRTEGVTRIEVIDLLHQEAA